MFIFYISIFSTRGRGRGASQFNQRNMDAARQQKKKVRKIDAHIDSKVALFLPLI